MLDNAAPHNENQLAANGTPAQSLTNSLQTVTRFVLKLTKTNRMFSY